jgi:hypothetical protein
VKKDSSLHISVGGFVIKVVFNRATTPLYHHFRESLIKTIRIYYKSFILTEHPKEFDFTIQLTDMHFPKLVQIENPSYKNRVFIDAGILQNSLLVSNYQISQFQFVQFIHFAVNSLLKKSGGAVFHASSCMVDGRVHVFFAPSGGGKSTIMQILRKCHGVKPFSDEFVILKREGSTIRAYQMPLIEKNFVPKSYQGVRVAACYFLEKSKETHLEKIADKKHILEHLMKQSYFYGLGAPPHLSFLKHITISLPFSDLMFMKDSSQRNKLVRFLRLNIP